MKIRLGVIGCGMAYEKLHLPVLRKLSDMYEIVAISDIDEIRLSIMGRKSDVRKRNLYLNYKEMLNREDIDTILVAVPIPKTYEVVKDVILANKNIMVEKPLATEAISGLELIELASKLKLLVLENYRFNEETTILKNIIDEEKIGKITYFEELNMTDFSRDMLKDTFASKEWRQHPKYKGGAFLDSSIHHISRLRFLFGNVKKVTGMAINSKEECNDFSTMINNFAFENDVIGTYTYSIDNEELIKPFIGLRIFGTKGEALLEGKNSNYISICYKDGKKEKIRFKPNQGYLKEFEHFYEMYASNKRNRYPNEEVLLDLKLITEIIRKYKK